MGARTTDYDAPLTHFFDPRVGGMLHAIALGFGTLNGTDNAAKVDCETCLSIINAEDARTHGREHAPLPAGALLAPGYCAGCDSERPIAPGQTAESDARRPGCEMHGCSTAAVGIGDIDGDEYWLCDKHRYPIPPEASEREAGR